MIALSSQSSPYGDQSLLLQDQCQAASPPCFESLSNLIHVYPYSTIIIYFHPSLSNLMVIKVSQTNSKLRAHLALSVPQGRTQVNSLLNQILTQTPILSFECRFDFDFDYGSTDPSFHWNEWFLFLQEERPRMRVGSETVHWREGEVRILISVFLYSSAFLL